jgi:hypothetical protein
MFAQLYITEAGRPDHTVALEDKTTIGRDNENDIVLMAPTVSRHHAMLLRDVAGMLLVDLESTNGTCVNGVQVQPDEPVRLADGDVIWLGQVVTRYAAPPLEDEASAQPAGWAPSQPAESATPHVNVAIDACSQHRRESIPNKQCDSGSADSPAAHDIWSSR